MRTAPTWHARLRLAGALLATGMLVSSCARCGNEPTSTGAAEASGAAIDGAGASSAPVAPDAGFAQRDASSGAGGRTPPAAEMEVSLRPGSASSTRETQPMMPVDPREAADIARLLATAVRADTACGVPAEAEVLIYADREGWVVDPKEAGSIDHNNCLAEHLPPIVDVPDSLKAQGIVAEHLQVTDDDAGVQRAYIDLFTLRNAPPIERGAAAPGR